MITWRTVGGAVFVVALLALGAGPHPARAQTGFTEYALTDTTLNSDPSTDFWIASAAPADVDGDGDLDLLVAGYYVVYYVGVEERLTLYRNDGPAGPTTWALTPIPVDATGLYFNAADLAWGDYDNDGDPDVLVGAYTETALYRNDGGTLTRTSTVLPAYLEDADGQTMDLHSISWGDYDNDGDLDLLLPSVYANYQFEPTTVLRNDGPGAGTAWTFTDVAPALPVAANALSAWADLERDGDLDLLLGNVSAYGDNFLNVYRNTGGAFAAADTGLAHIRYGMADWGDVDGDGDLDIAYGGNLDLPNGFGETMVRVLYKNAGPGYTPVDVAVGNLGDPNEPWLDFNAVTWADYDSDGDMDLLVSGEFLEPGEIVGRAVIYANLGGTFAPASAPLPAPIMGNAGGAFTWFDVDSDGDLDYFVAGGYLVPNGNGLVEARTQLFRNNAPGHNAPPTAPANLQTTPVGANAMRLAWSPAQDDGTAPAALTYELEVVRAGSSTPVERALPEPGNVSRNTAWTLRHLGQGSYTWRVRAVDSAFNGGPAAQGSFVLGTSAVAEPVVAARPLWLSAPWPNPANAAARLTLRVEEAQRLDIALFDVSGRRVARLREGFFPVGEHDVKVDGSALPNGTYFVRATGGRGDVARRMTVRH